MAGMERLAFALSGDLRSGRGSDGLLLPVDRQKPALVVCGCTFGQVCFVTAGHPSSVNDLHGDHNYGRLKVSASRKRSPSWSHSTRNASCPFVDRISR